MASTTTTVTSKMQVTIPEEVRKLYPLKAGAQLTWSVEGDALVARRIRGVAELAGCLKSDVPFPGIAEEKRAVEALRAKHGARKYGKS
ncbi:MAG: AbrB/MazE/SpoVT family DNA-binding domain-containing protein [Bryobacteraceae bacterium]